MIQIYLSELLAERQMTQAELFPSLRHSSIYHQYDL